MSRIGRQKTEIPAKTEVTVDGDTVIVKGPLGELSKTFPSREVSISINDGFVEVIPKRQALIAQMLWGTWSSHVRNMVLGVNDKYEKKLVIEGVGYRAEISADKLKMQLGFSHPVEITIPKDLDVTVEKDLITVSGIDKERVGHFAAVVRTKKKPEPYKGKGIRYADETIRRKQGKKAVGAGG